MSTTKKAATKCNKALESLSIKWVVGKCEAKNVTIQLVHDEDGRREIHLNASQKRDIIKIGDIIGVSTGPVDENLNLSNQRVQLEIISYPLVKGKKRQRNVHKFECTCESALQFNEIIKTEIAYETPTHLSRNTELSLENRRHYIVLVNPYSGQKRALFYWKSIAETIFQEAGITYDMHLTEKAGHATTIAKGLNLNAYDGLVVCSGDGMINEVLKGFLMRGDRRRAMRMPIAHLPGGTSNGLAAAICYQCNEPFSPRGNFFVEAALLVARPRYLPLRLCHVETECNGSYCMFQSASWGLMADVDIGSERFRWAGMIRLHMEAVIRISQLPSTARYRARISYLPAPRSSKNLEQATMLKHNDDRKLFGDNHFTYKPVPVYEENEQLSTSVETDKLSDAFRGTHLVPGGQVAILHYPYTLGLFQIPPLSEPVPSDWITFESEFVFVCVSSLSHLGSDLPYIPSSRLDDDFLYLTLCDWNTVKTRFHVAQMLITLDQSKHLRHPCLQIIPARACRIEPLDNCGGHLAIDGEFCCIGSAFQVAATSFCATVTGREERH